jgi:hypothetical protein
MKYWNIFATALMILGGIMASLFSWKGDALFWRGFPWWKKDVWVDGKTLTFIGYFLMPIGLIIYIISSCRN